MKEIYQHAVPGEIDINEYLHAQELSQKKTFFFFLQICNILKAHEKE